MSKFVRLRLVGALVAVGIAMLGARPALASSASGTIAVSLTVTDACVVNGATAFTTSLGQVGAIDFGTQPGLFSTVNASLVATGGGSAISILCSPGETPTLTIGAGAHDSSGVHRLASGTDYITYHLFTDSAYSDEITIGRALALGTTTTTAINVPIYAQTNSGGLVMPGGSYTDTVQVTLAW